MKINKVSIHGDNYEAEVHLGNSIVLTFPHKSGFSYYGLSDWETHYNDRVMEEKYGDIFNKLLSENIKNLNYDLTTFSDKKIEEVLNSIMGCNIENVSIMDGSSISGKSKIVNLELKGNSEISSSTIENDNIVTFSSVKIRGSEIYDSMVQKSEISSKTFIKKANIINSTIKNSIIENDHMVEIDNSSIFNSNIKNVNFTSTKIIRGLNNLKCSKNYCSISDSTFNARVENYLEINGTLNIKESFFNSRNLLLQNNDGQVIHVFKSIITGDSSIFGNVKITGSNLSGNCVIFDEAIIYGSSQTSNDDAPEKEKLKISGYSKIFGKAIIRDAPKISGFVNIYGESEVSDKAKIYGKVNVLDDARVSGESKLYDKEIVNKYEERFE